MYQLGNSKFDTSHANARQLLATAHSKQERPLCLCKTPPIPMYIAKHGDLFLVKRMPGTGFKHSPDCESYEPPAELSGLGEVAGAAIQENVEDGTVALRLDFALSKQGARIAPAPAESEKDTARTDGKKLTLRGVLHYLWDQAGFTRWAPAMEGKRNWRTIQKYLTQAASDKTAKGAALDASLFVPESFDKEQWDAIKQRRGTKLAPLSKAGGARKLMIVVGEVKAIDRGRYDMDLIVKHLPDMKFTLNADIHRRLEKRFERELSMWKREADGHLIVIATFGLNSAGYAVIEEAALMFTDKHWLPCENVNEMNLLKTLVDAERHFSKGLRYNLPASRPMAFAVMHDTRPLPVALYVLPADCPDGYEQAFNDLVQNSHLAGWYWRPPQALPELPALDGYSSMEAPTLAATEETVSPAAAGDDDAEGSNTPAPGDEPA